MEVVQPEAVPVVEEVAAEEAVVALLQAASLPVAADKSARVHASCAQIRLLEVEITAVSKYLLYIKMAASIKI